MPTDQGGEEQGHPAVIAASEALAAWIRNPGEVSLPDKIQSELRIRGIEEASVKVKLLKSGFQRVTVVAELSDGRKRAVFRLDLNPHLLI